MIALRVDHAELVPVLLQPLEERGGERRLPAPPRTGHEDVGPIRLDTTSSPSGDAQVAQVEERVVVLGIADADDVVRREAELLERCRPPGRLTHRERLHRALAERLDERVGRPEGQRPALARGEVEHDRAASRLSRTGAGR